MNRQNEQANLADLVAKSQAGNRNAQERLVRAVQDRVFFHCRKILKNQDDAMDAAQDILIAMFKNLKNLKDPNAFNGWLAQITCRMCWKAAAKRSRERAVLAELADAADFDGIEDSDSQSAPDAAFDTEETRRIVREIVDELPPDQAACVLLYYYDELSVKDIADAVGVSEGTVKSRLYYARQNMKKSLEKYSDVPFYSPVPFLRYFLRREASGLTVSAAKAMSDAVLAAVAVTAVPKGVIAAAVAGIALAGVLAAGVLPGRNIADMPVTPATPPDDSRPPVVDVQIPDAPVMPVPAEPAAAVMPDAPAPQIQRLAVSQPTPGIVPIPVVPVLPDTGPETEPEAGTEPAAPAPDTVLIVVNDIPAEPVPERTPIPVPKPTELAPPPAFVQPAVPTPEPAPSQPESPPGSSDTYEPYDPYDPYEPYEPYEPDEPVPVVPDTPEPEPEPTVINQEPVDFGINGGYGYTYFFDHEWDGDLPENLVFSSSDPSVVAINGDGEFSTLTPGQAVLTAEDPDNPGVRYTLTLDVQDRFNWRCDMADQVVPVGVTVRGGSSFNQYFGNTRIVSAVWTSGDSSVVEVIPVPNPTSCELYGAAPGETDVHGTVFFTVDTIVGTREMQDKVSFHVTVPAPETPETPEMPEETESGTENGETAPAPDEPDTDTAPENENTVSEPENENTGPAPENVNEPENVTEPDAGSESDAAGDDSQDDKTML